MSAPVGYAPGRVAAPTVGVLWDLDGTLVDSAGDIAAAVDRTLPAFGLPPLGEPRVRSFVGDGARVLVERCAAAAGGDFAEAMLTRFLAEYGAHVCERTRIHPAGLVALLPRCAAPMAVVTNKPVAHSLAILDALGLRRFFPVVLGGDCLPERKPHPAPLREAMRRLGVTRAVMVGDGTQDVQAAAAAGLPAIGVGWGIHMPVGAAERVADVPALEAALRRRGVEIR